MTIWTGTISFGMVTIAVKLDAASENRRVSFHQVRASDGSRIRMRRVAEADGQEVAREDIARGYPTPDGMIIVSDEDVASLPLPTRKTIEVERFVPADQVDPIYLDQPYYLTPANDAARRAYRLLHGALADTGRIGITKLALRERERVATLRPYRDVILLHTMRWPDEVRATPAIPIPMSARPTQQQREAAMALVGVLTSDTLDLAEYHDGYREATLAMLAEKTAPAENVGPAAVARLAEAVRHAA